MEELKEWILNYYREGKVVYQSSLDEAQIVLMEKFIRQPTSGILYDLNHDVTTTLTSMPKTWINDLAVAYVIRALKDRIEELADEIKQLETA